MSGRCARCCCSACHHGRSQRWCEQTVVVGSSQKRGSDQALCVHTAGFKGITRAQRTAGGPREPSSLDLFIPQKIGWVSLWYLSAASRYATHQRRLRIEHVNSSVKRCRIVKDRLRLWKKGVRDLVMELCCALHNFRVRLNPWQPMV